MSNDSNAFKTVQTLPGLTAEEQQYLLTVSRGEGFYGLGWGNPSADTIALSNQFGIDPRAGVGSNNWGAEQGQGSAGSFPHVDHHANGTPYVEQYKKHGSATEGAASVAKILLKPNVREALSRGDIKAAVMAQYANGYFELNPEKYLTAVLRNYNALTKNLKWPVLLTIGGRSITADPLVLPGSESPDSPDTFSGVPSERPVLRRGNSGDSVLLLQQLLGHLKLDSIFGPLTEAKVRQFQLTHGLKADGIVGPLTWKELDGT